MRPSGLFHPGDLVIRKGGITQPLFGEPAFVIWPCFGIIRENLYTGLYRVDGDDGRDHLWANYEMEVVVEGYEHAA